MISVAKRWPNFSLKKFEPSNFWNILSKVLRSPLVEKEVQNFRIKNILDGQRLDRTVLLWKLWECKLWESYESKNLKAFESSNCNRNSSIARYAATSTECIQPGRHPGCIWVNSEFQNLKCKAIFTLFFSNFQLSNIQERKSSEKFMTLISKFTRSICMVLHCVDHCPSQGLRLKLWVQGCIQILSFKRGISNLRKQWTSVKLLH